MVQFCICRVLVQGVGAELLSGAQPSVLLLPVLSSDAMSSAGAGWNLGPCACVVY